MFVDFEAVWLGKLRTRFITHEVKVCSITGLAFVVGAALEAADVAGGRGKDSNESRKRQKSHQIHL